MCDQRDMVPGEDMALLAWSHILTSVVQSFGMRNHPSNNPNSTGSLSYLFSGKAISRPYLTWDLTCVFLLFFGICLKDGQLVHCQRNSCPPSAHHSDAHQLPRWLGAPGVLFPHHGRTVEHLARHQRCRGGAELGMKTTLEMGHFFDSHVSCSIMFNCQRLVHKGGV